MLSCKKRKGFIAINDLLGLVGMRFCVLRDRSLFITRGRGGGFGAKQGEI